MNTEEIIVQDHERPHSKKRNRTNGGFPKFGCIILCMLIAFILGIAINVVVTGARTLNGIIPYTQNTPLALPEERGTEVELQAARSKIKQFHANLSAEPSRPANLNFTVKDLNILIANDSYLSDLRGEYFFTSVSNNGKIKALCSRKIRKFLPWQERRYWNGEFELELEVLSGAVFLRVKKLMPSNGSSLPEKMQEKWSSQDQLDMYKNDDRFADALKKINSIRFEENSITVSTKETLVPSSTQNDNSN